MLNHLDNLWTLQQRCGFSITLLGILSSIYQNTMQLFDVIDSSLEDVEFMQGLMKRWRRNRVSIWAWIAFGYKQLELLDLIVNLLSSSFFNRTVR